MDEIMATRAMGAIVTATSGEVKA